MSVASNPTSTLQQIAKAHAASTALTDSTRAVFRRLAEGRTLAEFAGSTLSDAFYEAALSTATRAGQSMERRAMGANLNRLRAAVMAGDSILPTVQTFTVKVEGDGDLIRRALLNLPPDAAARVVYVSLPEEN
jgi:hypothetical protein